MPCRGWPGRSPICFFYLILNNALALRASQETNENNENNDNNENNEHNEHDEHDENNENNENNEMNKSNISFQKGSQSYGHLSKPSM